MIYTVTFNPSLDYIVYLDTFTPNAINRTTDAQIFCGGKGINVSIVLNNLNIPSTALGFIAGFTGNEIQRRLQALGCHSKFIELADGCSRINVKIKATEEGEINGQGPLINEIALQSLFAQLEDLRAGDILVLAGSIPNTLPNDIYEKIMVKLSDKEIKIVVDATGKLLLNVLKYKPFLIKPNNHELGEMFNVKITTEAELIFYAKKLQTHGAQNVLISRAGDGAILLTAEQIVYKSAAPTGKVINSVGAGDSMVAGFLAGFLENQDLSVAFKMGVATGSATAFAPALATKAQVETLLLTLA